jgi:hypothetical protein
LRTPFAENASTVSRCGSAIILPLKTGDYRAPAQWLSSVDHRRRRKIIGWTEAMAVPDGPLSTDQIEHDGLIDWL